MRLRRTCPTHHRLRGNLAQYLLFHTDVHRRAIGCPVVSPRAGSAGSGTVPRERCPGPGVSNADLGVRTRRFPVRGCAKMSKMSLTLQPIRLEGRAARKMRARQIGQIVRGGSPAVSGVRDAWGESHVGWDTCAPGAPFFFRGLWTCPLASPRRSRPPGVQSVRH